MSRDCYDLINRLEYTSKVWIVVVIPTKEEHELQQMVCVEEKARRK